MSRDSFRRDFTLMAMQANGEFNGNATRIAVTVEQVNPNGDVAVRHGTGLTDIQWLTGIARPHVKLSLGDKGNIIYRRTGNYGSGFWFWEDTSHL